MPLPLAHSRSLPALFLIAIFCTVASAQDVLTYHNNNARTGLDNKETILTLANVNSATFGKLFTVPADGLVDAQPLYISRRHHRRRHPQSPHRRHRARHRLRLRRRHRISHLADHHAEVRRDHLRRLADVPRSAPKSESPPLPSSPAPRPAIRSSTSSPCRRTALATTTSACTPSTPPAAPNFTSGPVDITGQLSRHRRQQFRRLRHLRSRPIQRARRTALARRHHLSRLGLALRLPPLHRMDHGLQPDHADADH